MLQQRPVHHEHFSEHRDFLKYTWCRDSLGQRSLIDFCILSLDLLQSVLDVRVKKGGKLVTDHHLIVCKLCLKIRLTVNERDN